MGREHFCKFCRTMKDLLQTQTFDLLVAAGNTGSIVARFTETIYAHLHLKPPPTLRIPLFRFLPGHEDDTKHLFDTLHHLPMVIEQLRSLSPLRNVLFVDDEISRGLTAVSLFRLISEALRQLGRDTVEQFTIVAEDQGFKVPDDCPGMHFMPFAQEKKGYGNVIFYATPPKLEEPIIRIVGDDDLFAFHKRCSLLLGLPIKDFNNGMPIFSDSILRTVEKQIPDFPTLQKEYEQFIEESIQQCLS